MRAERAHGYVEGERSRRPCPGCERYDYVSGRAAILTYPKAEERDYMLVVGANDSG